MSLHAALEPAVEEAGLSRRLKERTTAAHQRLDRSIMAGAPFADRARYGRFLAVQQSFHADIEALYADPGLGRLLPDLAARSRLSAIENDLADLGVEASAPSDGPAFPAGAPFDDAEALGWLYVAEGSNLGAAFLLKEAAKLGLSTEFGARHLAPAPDGRGLNWRVFAAALDAVPLDADGAARAVAGAEAAFARVQGLVRASFG
ncbi:biliverdin-producing heme oxygenase [Methylopila henanensis]|uniref:Biliverdin-producing heme oxygenase n=1 Tax=Methylopila henanensis TaxID=873516 RepID=A0ABW4K5P2_9HYPH